METLHLSIWAPMSCQAGEFILWNLERKNTVKSSVRYKKCEVKNLPLDVKKCEVKKTYKIKQWYFITIFPQTLSSPKIPYWAMNPDAEFGS